MQLILGGDNTLYLLIVIGSLCWKAGTCLTKPDTTKTLKKNKMPNQPLTVNFDSIQPDLTPIKSAAGEKTLSLNKYPNER